MKYLADANICILLFADANERLSRRVEETPQGAIGVSAIVFAELALGSWNGKTPPMAALDRLPSVFPVLPFDELAARFYARLPFARGSFDRLIAAHALSLNLTLISANERDFAGIPGLCVENWTQ